MLIDSPRPTATTPTVWYPNSSTTRTAPSTPGTSRPSTAAVMATSLTMLGSVGHPGCPWRATRQHDLLGPCSVQHSGPGCLAAAEPPQQCCSDSSTVPNQQPVADGYASGFDVSRGNRYRPCWSRRAELTNFSPPGAPTTAADEAADLQRALAESAAESGLPPQEAGVVDNDTSVKHFGPANRSEYDQEQWALVPTKADEAAKPEPAPSARQRAPGTPAFLRSVKGRTNRHRTGGLVSIFHTIPATRNIMMLSGPLANNYGNHLDWWKGAPITKSVQYGTELSGDEDRPEFTEELQRLVAFLDGTERAYGTVDVLAETKAVDPSLGEWRPQHLEANFLSALLDAGISCAPEHINAMVSAAGLERALPEPDFEAGSAERFSFLDLKLEGESCSQVNTLYDALDRLFWNQAFSDSSQVMDEPVSAILETASDVFTIKFGGDGINKAIDIPAILYLDRYSSTRKDLAKLLQSRIRKTREMGLATIKKWEESALTCHGESGCRQMPDWLSNPHNSRNCWQKMIVTCEGLLERQRKNAQWRSMQSRMDEGAVPTLRDLYDLTTWSLPYELTDEERKKQQKWEQCIKTARERLEGINEQFTRMWPYPFRVAGWRALLTSCSYRGAETPVQRSTREVLQGTDLSGGRSRCRVPRKVHPQRRPRML